jgi:EmrB/QacA subfamily drug resistance transporter
VARQWKVLMVTSVAVFMALLDVTIVNIAFPDMRRSFATASLSDLSWVLNAYNVVFAAALVPLGRLADRIGRRRLFLVGLVVFMLASLACGLAPSVPILVGARVVQAIGAAAIVPTSLSLVLPEFPIERRATAVSLSTATGAIAAIAGPTLGGVLVDWQGWRWVFFVNLVIGLAALIPARRLLRETEKDTNARWPDAFGALLLTAAIAILALSLVKGDDWGWGSPLTLGGLATAVVLTAGFVLRSARHPSPVFELELFKIRSFSVANAGSFAFSVGFYALLLCNVLFLTGAWHFSVLTAGIAATPGSIMATLSAPVAGRLADRYGSRPLAIVGGLLFGGGALLLALRTGTQPDYAGEVLPSLLMTGTGVGLTLPAFGSAGVSQLPSHRFATGIAISSGFRQIGAVVGIAALVAILQGGAYQDVWFLIAGTGVLSTIAGIALGARARVQPVEDDIEAAAPLAGRGVQADGVVVGDHTGQ